MRRALPALLACLAVLGGCGGGSRPVTRAPAAPRDPGGLAVVRAWADALRTGRVDRAASLFALPAVVQNGAPAQRLSTRAAVRRFNVSLPCGARVLYGIPHHGWLLVEFRLTDRRGEGAVSPCRGRGGTAATALRVVRGRIHDWLRVPDMQRPAPNPAPGNPS